MSFIFSKAVWDCPLPDPNTRLVLLRLAFHASDEGLAWPSLATLARYTGLGLSTVKRKIAWLVRNGLIDRRSSKDRSTSNRYVLSLAKIRQAFGGAAPITEPSPSAEGGVTVDQGLVHGDLGVGSERAGGRATVGHESSEKDQGITNEPNEKQTTPEVARLRSYPSSETEARSLAETAGVPAEYAILLWHECEGVGGKDFNGNPVTHFASFIKGCWTRKQENDRRRRSHSPSRDSKPLSAWEKQVAVGEKRWPNHKPIAVREL